MVTTTTPYILGTGDTQHCLLLGPGGAGGGLPHGLARRSHGLLEHRTEQQLFSK